MSYHFLAGLILGAAGAVFANKNKYIKDFAKEKLEKAKQKAENLKDFAIDEYEKVTKSEKPTKKITRNRKKRVVKKVEKPEEVDQ